MLRYCALCGKGKEVGHNVSYSKRRTRRVFLPNLSWVKLNLDGQVGKMRICMKCLKKMKKEGKVVTGKVSKVVNEPNEIKETKVKMPRRTRKKAH